MIALNLEQIQLNCRTKPINNKLNYNQIRATLCSKSLRHRFSDLKTFKQFEFNGNISSDCKFQKN